MVCACNPVNKCLRNFALFLLCFLKRDTKANSAFTVKGKQQCGKDLGWHGFLIAVKGDWKFEKEFFCQYRAYNSNRICCCCSATKDGQHPFVDQFLIMFVVLSICIAQTLSDMLCHVACAYTFRIYIYIYICLEDFSDSAAWLETRLSDQEASTFMSSPLYETYDINLMCDLACQCWPSNLRWDLKYKLDVSRPSKTLHVLKCLQRCLCMQIFFNLLLVCEAESFLVDATDDHG